MLTIAIPTYNRGTILVDTIARLLALDPPASEIVIADQTREHPPDVAARLAAWHAEGAIRHLRLPEPSIPHAMNVALYEARHELVLFLDDDLIPEPALVGEHLRAHRDPTIWAVAGQVLQPGEEPVHVGTQTDSLQFRFNSDTGAFLTNVMAGNLSVRRARALAIGGFDENYIGAAYRFESDFAFRIAAAGGRIWFEPRACIHHLKLATGGLRAFGDHRSTISPAHAAGDYYFALTHQPGFAAYALRRLRQNILTRWHLRHPYAIPTKLIGELRGMLLGWQLHRRGPRLATPPGNVRPAPDLPGTTDR
jgi:GT2 family glycosyltransferase